MATAEDNAVAKVLQLPELLEKLVLHLDINSVASLAEVQPGVIKILQRTKLWLDLIKRSCRGWKIVNCPEDDLEEAFEQKRHEIANLVKMMKKMDEPTSLILPGLLHDILHEGTNQGITMVELRCSGCLVHWFTSEHHKAWEWHFLLLEEVEQAFGSALQEVVTLKMNPLQGKRFRMRRSWLLAAASRARRQQSKIALVDIVKLPCIDKVEADTFLALAENCRELKVRELKIIGDIGREGWTALANGLRRHPYCHLWGVEAPISGMLAAGSEDLKTIWEQLFSDSRAQWLLTDNVLLSFTRRGSDEDRENEWRRLEKVLDTKRSCHVF